MKLAQATCLNEINLVGTYLKFNIHHLNILQR